MSNLTILQTSLSKSPKGTKDACPLNGQCQIGEVFYEGTLPSNQPNYK